MNAPGHDDPALPAQSKQVQEAGMKLSAPLVSRISRRLGVAVLAAVVATTISTPVAVAAPAAPPAQTMADPLCAGVFTSWWSPAVITIRRSPAPVGRLDWNFVLTPLAKLAFGPYLTVQIDRAYINGREITSPYGPHFEVNTYDFHASMTRYNWKGSSGGGTIRTGDQLAMYWSLSSDTAYGQAAIVCTIPDPGVG
jgi:hypothetical protein